jgi:hypothetical protein
MTDRVARAGLLLALLWLFAPAAGAAEGEPAWLVAARAREGTLAEPQRVVAGDGAVSFSVPARVVRPVSFAEGSYELGLDIGSKVPVSCEILTDTTDLANFLAATSTVLFDNITANLGGQIQARAVERIDAGAANGAPYLTLDWAMVIRTGEEARLGIVKQAVGERDGHVVYCAHDDIGYATAFRAVFTGILESLAVAKPPPAPRYRSIYLLATAGQPLGLQVNTLVTDGDGDLKMTSQASLLVPVDGGLTTIEEALVEWSRPDGALINAAYVLQEGAQTTTRLGLAEADGRWFIDGTQRGSAVRQELAAGDRPSSLLPGSRALRDLAGGDEPEGRSLTLRLWAASVEPARLVDVTTRLAALVDGGGIAATQSLGTMEVDMVIERATGDTLRATLPIASQKIDLTRLHTVGAF